MSLRLMLGIDQRPRPSLKKSKLDPATGHREQEVESEGGDASRRESEVGQFDSTQDDCATRGG